MINFLQYNYAPLIAIVVILIFAYIGTINAKRWNVEEAVPFVKWICIFAIIVNVGVIINTTFLNQIPKRTIDRSYLEQSTNKYQESVINNANKGK